MGEAIDDSVYEMSDEDFDKLPIPEDDIDEDQEEEDASGDEDVTEEDNSSEEENQEEGDPEETEEDDSDSSTDKDSDSDEEEDQAGEEKEEDTGDSGEVTDPKAEDAIDYEAGYKKLMGTFKANGKDMTPKTVDDAIRLMQMGVGFHGKMAGLKPSLKAVKKLQNNDLLNEADLDFLIDLKQGKPEAITQLLKDNKIDPMDVDIKTEDTYIPTTHEVSDAEIDLDQVMLDIKHSPNYAKTLTTVSKEWDDSSQNDIATNPQIIKVINEHMDNGVYDKVSAAVQYERSLGNLTGVSDFEAYKAMGNKLQEEGAFGDTTQTETSTKVDPKPAVDPVKEANRKKRKKAAGTSKSSSSKIGKLPADFNPLNLSDEEFEKFDPALLGIKLN